MMLVLDTSALWHQPLLEALAAAKARGLMEDGRLAAILPAVAHAERLRQLRGDRRRERDWQVTLGRAGVQVEAFGVTDAERVASWVPDEETWRRHARDYLIAAHVHGDRIGVTEDRGPAWGTLPALTASEAVEAIGRLRGGRPAG